MVNLCRPSGRGQLADDYRRLRCATSQQRCDNPWQRGGLEDNTLRRTAGTGRATAPKLSQSQQLMRLKAEPPPRVLQTVLHCRICMLGNPRTIHRLEVEILEVQAFEQGRIEICLREDELQLIARSLDEGRSRLGTDADPVE